MTEQRWALGMDIGGSKIEVASVKANGEIQNSLFCQTEVQRGYPAVLEECVRMAQQLQKEMKSAPSGLGVGIAAQVSAKTGNIVSSPNLKWCDLPLQGDLRNCLNLPVIVMNDVRAATWGEWKHGAAQQSQNFVCLFVGTGVGGGLVCNGKLLEGVHNTAGELGHMTIEIDGMPCTCGNCGCLETFAGGWAIAARAKERLKGDFLKNTHLKEMADSIGIEQVTAHHVFEAAKMKDPLALEIVENVVSGLIAGAVSIVNIFNPSHLIFGGGIIHHHPELLPLIEKGLRGKALKPATKSLKVVATALKNSAVAIGAASYLLEEMIFSRE